MQSPFPGMDPYLEHPAFWRDFHECFITYARDWLFDHLPDHYDVRIDERVGIVDESDATTGQMLPDINISQLDPLPLDVPGGNGGVALEVEPVTLAVPYTEAGAEAFLRIFHRGDSTLITVLELLSPTNKADPDRGAYLQKRREVLSDNVHLVEIDLLLGGKRLPIVGKLPKGHYYAYVSRGDQRPLCEVYGWSLRQRLSAIRVPLKAPDADVIFDLPELLRLTYQRGRYRRVLPYEEAPPVALGKSDEKWVLKQLSK